MSIEEITVAACIVLLIVCYFGYRWTFKNVHLKYKDQKAWGGEHK